MAKVKSAKSKKTKADKENIEQYKIVEEYLQLIGELIILPKSKDICPIIREEIYSVFTDFLSGNQSIDSITTLDRKSEQNMVYDLLYQAILDDDKSARSKGIQTVKQFLSVPFLKDSKSKTDKDGPDFYKTMLNIVVANLMTNSDTIDILAIFANYEPGWLKGTVLSSLKKLIFHPDPKVCKTVIEIMRKVNILESTEMTSQTSPGSQLTENFKFFSLFLNDA